MGDIYKKRLKATAASLGTGTADETTYLRGDGTWQTPAAVSDISNLENTLVMMAWDVYSEDRAFDDIYADDLTDQTGIDTVNSTGTYNSGSSYYQPTVATTGSTTDYTSSQLDTTHWTDINSVAVTQSTPGDVTASAIYHAVSFDGGTNYKVYKSSAWTIVAKNNSGTWQYNNAGTLTNASTNSLAGAMAQSTAQSAYQWTKTDIEAMSDANWEASGGWLTSVNTIDWTYRLVTGTSYIGDGSQNTSESYATSGASSSNSSPYTLTRTSPYSSTYEAWKAFNRTLSGETDAWVVGGDPSTASPQCIMIDFGSGTVINKYAWAARPDVSQGFPTDWKLQGTTNTSAAVNDAETANGWTTLDTRASVSIPSPGQWSSFFTFTNTTAYRYYRIRITAGRVNVGEIKFVAATTTPATPTYTKTTFNHDTEHVALDLRTNGWEASANDPTDGYVVLDVEPVDAITNNTDIKAYMSIDNGSNYEQVTLEATPFREIGAHDYIRGDISGITSRTDKTIRFKVTSHNSKNFKLHGLGGGVKY